MSRPGIRRSRVRSPQLALAELRALQPPVRPWSPLRSLYKWIRSLSARGMKAGL